MRPSIFRHSTVQSDVLRYIVENEFKPGDSLPTIQEMARSLNVSVAKVRESLEIARTLGVVEIKPGRGMRVLDYTFSPAMTLSGLYAIGQETDNFGHLGQMRNALEAYFWDEAVSLLQPDDFEELHRLIRHAQQKLECEPIQVPAAEHRIFHLTFFRRLNNPFVLGVLDAFWTAYEAFGLNLYMELDYHRTVWNYHTRIVEAIEAGEIEESRRLLVAHMNLLGDRQNQQGVITG